MVTYASKSGKQSGIVAYEIGEDYIKVKFRTKRKIYTYSRRSAGMEHVRKMKQLALAAKGLSTYISQHKPAYE